MQYRILYHHYYTYVLQLFDKYYMLYQKRKNKNQQELHK